MAGNYGRKIVDTNGDPYPLAEAGRQGNWATVDHGQQSVATAGTAEALNGGTSLTVPDGSSLAVRANGGNAGNIYVGDSTVASTNGFILGAGESIGLQVSDVADVYIDADNAGEGVSWIVESE